jgi:hypothetical protein
MILLGCAGSRIEKAQQALIDRRHRGLPGISKPFKGRERRARTGICGDQWVDSGRIAMPRARRRYFRGANRSRTVPSILRLDVAVDWNCSRPTRRDDGRGARARSTDAHKGQRLALTERPAHAVLNGPWSSQ